MACDRHLRSEETGRVALVVDDHPEIFPVNYMVDDSGDVYFRTDPGTKLHAVAKAPLVAFEVDGIDAARHLAWSVLVVGKAVHIGDSKKITEVLAALRPWAAGERAEVVRLRPEKVTGRWLSSSPSGGGDDSGGHRG